MTADSYVARVELEISLGNYSQAEDMLARLIACPAVPGTNTPNPYWGIGSRPLMAHLKLKYPTVFSCPTPNNDA